MIQAISCIWCGWKHLPPACTISIAIKWRRQGKDQWVWRSWTIERYCDRWRLWFRVASELDRKLVGTFKRRDNAMRHVRDRALGRSRRS